jgi:hypothetical protein
MKTPFEVVHAAMQRSAMVPPPVVDLCNALGLTFEEARTRYYDILHASDAAVLAACGWTENEYCDAVGSSVQLAACAA